MDPKEYDSVKSWTSSSNERQPLTALDVKLLKFYDETCKTIMDENFGPIVSSLPQGKFFFLTNWCKSLVIHILNSTQFTKLRSWNVQIVRILKSLIIIIIIITSQIFLFLVKFQVSLTNYSFISEQIPQLKI